MAEKRKSKSKFKAGKQFSIESVASGLVFSEAGRSQQDRAEMHVWDDEGTNNQNFYFEPSGLDDYYLVYCLHSGKVFDIRANSTKKSAMLQQYSKHGKVNQQFMFAELPDGSYSIQARNSGYFLTSSKKGKPVVQQAWTGEDNQKFMINEA